KLKTTASTLTPVITQTDYFEYMMGHTISTYHDIRTKNIEYLRFIHLFRTKNQTENTPKQT
ncbi:MAG TPA: hypothetical protein VF350_06610, partial [Candidatus Bathyarchaeia archaeon]